MSVIRVSTRRPTRWVLPLVVGLIPVLASPAAGLTEDRGLPAALITPNGVVVSVVWDSAVGFWVLTPCGNLAMVTGGQPVSEVRVVIDPGHGGPIDTGAVGSTGMPEKDINLKIAGAVTMMLERRGIAAILTRSGDNASPLSIRAHLADSVGAELMVSIHHNAPSPRASSVPGIEIFIQKGSESSKRLGGLLWERAMTGLGVFDIGWVAAADSGVMTVLNTRGDDAYGIIRHPDTPTALIELGYISNPAEARLHQRPIYAWVAATAITDAIVDYLESEATGSGFVDGRTFNPRPGIGKDVCTDPDLG